MNRRNLIKSVASLGVLGVIPSQLKAEEEVLKDGYYSKEFKDGKVYRSKIEVYVGERCPAKELEFHGETFILTDLFPIIEKNGYVGWAVYYSRETKFYQVNYVDNLKEGELIDFHRVHEDLK